MQITWRDYQTEIIESVFSDWQDHQSLLAVAATGAGKTNILWGIADRFIGEKPGARVVVLAHRKELIEQPLARLNQFWPHLAKRAGIVMANSNECHRQIVIATVQTLGSKSGKRISEMLNYGKVDLLIVDECHHISAGQYGQVIDGLKAKNADLKLLGVTATPERGDKKSLAEIFQKESANVGVMRLIDEGHLCQPIVHGVKTNIDLSGVKVQGAGGARDYNNEQLVAAVETDDCFKLVVKTHMEKIANRPTIAFVPSVAGAYRLAALLCEQGVKAVAADGTTPRAEREAVITDFKAGRITCICNVALWTEGLDLPQLECCHLVRPTKSDALYLQMVGRTLRTHPGKESVDIFDYQPLGSRNLDMRMIKLGLKKRKPSVFGAMGGGGGGMVDKHLHRAGDHIEYTLLDYFGKRKEAWVTSHSGWRIVSMGKSEVDAIDRSLAVSPDGSQLWAVWKKEGDRWNQAKLALQGDFNTVTAKTEEFIKKWGNRSFLDANAAWRARKPTDSQVQFGSKLHVYVLGMNAGQLSDAINEKLILQAISRAQQPASEMVAA